MTKEQGIRITDAMRVVPEYLHAKRLFAERKELQARLREINRVLRQMQNKSGALVNLAKADLDLELMRAGSVIKD